MAYKRKEKKSLLLYYDYKDQFEMLTDEQLRKLIYAMIEFDKNDIEIELDKITKMAFAPIKRKLKDDKEKWTEICKTNSKNGKKSHQKNELATVNDRQRMVTKLTDIDSDSDSDKDIDSDSECVINNTPLKPPHDTHTVFDFALTLDENYEEKSLKERCKYCVEYNGDCVEESDGFDYYSCELKNKEDLEKYGRYWSFDNRVDEDECTHYLCESCLFRKENKE